MLKEEFSTFKTLTQDYIRIRGLLIKLEVIEFMSKYLARVIKSFTFVVLLCITLLTLTLGLGFYFNELMHSTYLGFFMTTGIYALLLIIIYAARKSIFGEKMRNKIINELTDAWTDEK